jgi:O-antigen ligase
VDHPHSNILHVAVSHGVVGVAIMLWFFLVLVRNGWYNRGSPEGYFVLVGALAVFVGGFLNTHVLDAGPAFFLAVLSGLQAGMNGNTQEGTVS